MVSLRCKMLVRSELDRLGIVHGTVELGEVNIKSETTEEQRSELRASLLRSGLEVMDDKRSVLIEKIKNIIVEMVHYSEDCPKVNASDYISEKLDLQYRYLSNVFSEVTGTTIENYIIAHKIERVKEYLLYDELTLTEIAYKLNYSSVAHLSNQFRKITGLTPTYFKSLKEFRRRVALENV